LVKILLYMKACLSLPVLWRIGQRDDDVLVDEDEEGQEEAQAHGADHVEGRQTLKGSHPEDGPVMNFKNRNCSQSKRRKLQLEPKDY